MSKAIAALILISCAASGLAARKGTRLTDNRDRIEQLALSRDGCPAVAVHIRGLRSRYDTPPSR